MTCNECENGGPGDPRHNGDVVGHRKFLIKEYKSIDEFGSASFCLFAILNASLQIFAVSKVRKSARFVEFGKGFTSFKRSKNS